MTDLDKLQRAFEATTQGEWKHLGVDGIDFDGYFIAKFFDGKHIENRDWAISAHNAFPALLAELRELRRAKEELEEVRKHLALSIELREQRAHR